MVFKDRQDAAEQLVILLQQDEGIKKDLKNVVVVSLLRGGIVVGDVISRQLKIDHIPLVVAKIPAPYNPELAIGALCFDVVYLQKEIVDSLALSKDSIENQIQIAKEKFNSYLERFDLTADYYPPKLKNKIAILTDDGIATGATAKAGLMYLKTQLTKKNYIAVPVAPSDFDSRGFDKEFIVHKDPYFSAVSQFYQYFPQVTDEEVKKLLIT